MKYEITLIKKVWSERVLERWELEADSVEEALKNALEETIDYEINERQICEFEDLDIQKIEIKPYVEPQVFDIKDYREQIQAQINASNDEQEALIAEQQIKMRKAQYEKLKKEFE